MSFKTLLQIGAFILMVYFFRHDFIAEDGTNYTKTVHFSVVGGFVMIAIILSVFPYFRVWRLSKKLSTSNIALPEEGLIEVEGKIGSDQPMMKSQSSAAYVYHYKKVTERRRSHNRSYEHIISEDTAQAPNIYVEAGTGKIYLDPAIEFKTVTEKSGVGSRRVYRNFIAEGDIVKAMGRFQVDAQGRKILLPNNYRVNVVTPEYLQLGNIYMGYAIQALFPLIFALLFSWLFLNSSLTMKGYQLSGVLLNQPNWAFSLNLQSLSFLIDMKMNHSSSRFTSWGLILMLGIFLISPVVFLITKISEKMSNVIGFLMLVVFNLWPATALLLVLYSYFEWNVVAFWLTWVLTFICTLVVRLILDHDRDSKTGKKLSREQLIQ